MSTPDWKRRYTMKEYEDPPINALLPMDMRARSTLNLFKTRTPHVVENALELAKYAGDDNDAVEFKKQRKTVIDFLEPQYQRIMTAHGHLANFIKEKGKIVGLHDEDYDERDPEAQTERMGSALEGALLLNKYGQAFHRDLTPEVELLVSLHQDVFDAYYEDETREKELATVYEQLRAQQCWYLWQRAFRDAAKDMQEQHLAIRDARKVLFSCDEVGSDKGCEIDAEEWRNDERLDLKGDYNDFDVVSDGASIFDFSLSEE